MRLKVSKALNSINTASSVVNAINFTWSVVSGVLHWYHRGEVHHTIKLTEEQKRHLANGGTLECEYDCGTILRAGG